MKKKKNTTKNTHSSQKQPKTRRNRILFLTLGLLVCFAIVISGVVIYNKHEPNPVSTYDVTPENRLLSTASTYNHRIEELYLEKVTKETVDLNGLTGEYLIYYTTPGSRWALNTREFNIKLAEGSIEEFGKFEFTDLSEKDINIIESAKSHIIAYINSSSVLKEKATLIEAVESVPFYKYTSVENDVDGLMNTSVATCLDDGIYINQKCEDEFCAYVATHELLHFINDITNTKLFYPSTNFEEAMTDALTRAINPCYSFKDSPHYGYSILFDTLYSYINIFKEDAIYAYFYGYDELFEKVDSADFILEHDAFVSAMLGYWEDSHFSEHLTSQIMEKWRRDFEKAS